MHCLLSCLPNTTVPATSGVSGALPSSVLQPLRLPAANPFFFAANNPLNKGLKSITGIFNGGKK